jgi:ankyrin repeat protein
MLQIFATFFSTLNFTGAKLKSMSTIKKLFSTAIIMLLMLISCPVFSSETLDLSGDVKKTEAQLKAKPDLVFNKDAADQTPLFNAAAYGKVETVKLLLSYKADVNAKNFVGATPLMAAIVPYEERTNIVKILLDAGADKDAVGGTQYRTALIYAAIYGQADVVKLLIDAKANIEAKDGDNVYGKNDPFPINHATALIWAAS